MTLIGKASLYLILIFLVSCSPGSYKEIRREGEAQTGMLARELRLIENREDLQKALPKLKKRFSKLANVLTAAEKYLGHETGPSFASEELFVELARIYEMKEGKALLESAQAEAIQILEK